jgi:hypothetical protein
VKVSQLLRLNLGSGNNPIAGFLNVDKFGDPDLRVDLEEFPWPWDDNSVQEVVLNHVLEHLGPTPKIYFCIIQELYRVCVAGALIQIVVPHPRHDNFLNDPTHVRPVTGDHLSMFSRKVNLQWKRDGVADSPLALYLNVDFDLESIVHVLDGRWQKRLEAGEIKHEQLNDLARDLNNVVEAIHFRMRVVKD